MVQLQNLRTRRVVYALTPDELSVTPDPDPNTFMLGVYYTARLLIAQNSDQQGDRTRANLASLNEKIQELENGPAFSGWQSYYTWLHGRAGLPLREAAAQFDEEAPLWTAQ